ncbi:pilus assembly protein TadG-related protein [Arthrobacter sp. UCD-GKA]|uniref:pilus assembly protein TadG-related protein n=1 Tax=Arthrobacter sp. UCD-GKA TaxID=1913576 RepID=UPI0009F194C4|nr:pilus assembly protein TadG-related protein [Arthrobacter sp. UCD-GKA]
MRWMTKKRTLERLHDDRGNSTVLVALLMVVLLSFAAISVDIGKFYWEKAQLQNGADAGALGVASACANDPSSPVCSSNPEILGELVDGNANDGVSVAEPAQFGYTVSGKKNSVTVVARASEHGATPNSISTLFARFLSPNPVTEVKVGATATAIWGPPKSATSTFPIAFSFCEIDSSPTGDGELKFLQAHGDTLTNCGPPSGQELPGGFGWLFPDSDSCSATTSIDDTPEPSNTGGGTDTLTTAACLKVLEEWRTTLLSGGTVEAVFPVFDFAPGQGRGGGYVIEAYAVIEIHGWFFSNGMGHDGLLMYPRPKHPAFPTGGGASKTGVVGKFLRYVLEDSNAEAGGEDFGFGTEVVSLSK